MEGREIEKRERVKEMEGRTDSGEGKGRKRNEGDFDPPLSKNSSRARVLLLLYLLHFIISTANCCISIYISSYSCRATASVRRPFGISVVFRTPS